MVQKQAVVSTEGGKDGAHYVRQAGRWRPLLAAVVAGLTASWVLAGVVGCRGPSELIALSPQMVGERERLETLQKIIMTSAGRWRRLDAKCEVVIGNLRIPRPGGQVRFRDGRLAIEKPGKVHLTCPATGPAAIKLVGDGLVYRVSMPVFKVDYAGRYGDPMRAEAAEIHFMPEDVASALDRTGLFHGKGQVLTHGPFYSRIYSLQWVDDQTPPLRMVNLALVERQRVQVHQLFKYDPDGTARVHMRLGRYAPFRAGGDESVEIPTVIRIDYPAEGTSIEIRLRDVKLNTELDAALFDVSG